VAFNARRPSGSELQYLVACKDKFSDQVHEFVEKPDIHANRAVRNHGRLFRLAAARSGNHLSPNRRGLGDRTGTGRIQFRDQPAYCSGPSVPVASMAASDLRIARRSPE